MKKYILAVVFASIAFSTVAMAESILPPAPENGQCFAQKWVPPVMDQGTTTVVVKEAFTEYAVTPAVFEKIDQNVILRDAYIEYVEKPPVFLTETIDVPTGGGAHWGLNECTNKLLEGDTAYCYTVTGEDGGTTPVEVIKVIEDAVLDEINHPEQSQIVEYYKLVTPSTVIQIDHPEETIELPTSSVTSPGSLNWYAVDCGGQTQPVEVEATLTTTLIKAIQQALNDAGYDAGTIDGIVGWNTRSAILNYKAMQKLPNTSVISVEMVEALGL